MTIKTPTMTTKRKGRPRFGITITMMLLVVVAMLCLYNIYYSNITTTPFTKTITTTSSTATTATATTSTTTASSTTTTSPKKSDNSMNSSINKNNENNNNNIDNHHNENNNNKMMMKKINNNIKNVNVSNATTSTSNNENSTTTTIIAADFFPSDTNTETRRSKTTTTLVANTTQHHHDHDQHKPMTTQQQQQQKQTRSRMKNPNHHEQQHQNQSSHYNYSNDSNISNYSKSNLQSKYPFTFGSCLLIKDDNQILPEWLAYHYTVLPLRHLIVAIDPLSLQDPRPILNLYRKHLHDLTIVIWTNQTEYMSLDNDDYKTIQDTYNYLKRLHPSTFTIQSKMNIHRLRQRKFYTKCLRYYYNLHSKTTTTTTFFKQQNLKKSQTTTPKTKTTQKQVLPPPPPAWIMLSDVDEYITYNTPLTGYPKIDNNLLPKRMGKQNETIAHYISNNKIFQKQNEKTLCRCFPRLNFVSNIEVDDVEEIQQYVPKRSSSKSSSSSSHNNNNQSLVSLELFNASMFHTIRYHTYGVQYGKKTTLPGKSLVQISNYNTSTLQLVVSNPHRPFDNVCDPNTAFPTLKQINVPFRFQHYIGSYETFVTRPSRPERSYDLWSSRNNITNKHKGIDTIAATTWLIEFTTNVLDGNYELSYNLTQQLRLKSLKESIQILEKESELLLLSNNNNNSSMITNNNNNNNNETTTTTTEKAISLLKPIFDWV